jgi:hypothetical protein
MAKDIHGPKRLAPRRLPDRAYADDLTCRDEHRRVFDSTGRRIGAVLTMGDAFAAWTKTASLGLFDTRELAEEAVFAAGREGPPFPEFAAVRWI